MRGVNILILVNKMTTHQKLATLSVDSKLRPIIVIDPGSHLAIGRIIRGLKQARTGLWPKYLGDTDVLISVSKGKEIEIYKLAATLTAQGYYLQETEEHKKLEQALAERKAYAAKVQAEMKAKAAKAAIPPMAFANKRFSFRPHPCGWRVTFATQSSFLSWAKGHQVSFAHLGKHHAIIPHLPVGITPKYDRTEKCAWVQPPVPTTSDPIPDSTWTRDQIKSWLNDRGVDTLGVNRKADLLELVNI